MSEPITITPQRAAFLEAWDKSGGDPHVATLAYYAAAEPAAPAAPATEPIAESREAEADVPNPFARADDPSPAALARLSSAELDQLEGVSPGLVDRILSAEDWDRRRAATAERDERDAARLAEETAIASDPDALERHFHERDVERFEQHYWQLSPGERRAEADRLGLDLASFKPPSNAFGLNFKERS